MSTLFVFLTLAPTVSQSRLARSSQRRSITSASTPDASAARNAYVVIARYVSTVTAEPTRRTRARPTGMQ
ncbi:hypothetical protein HD593_008901 [Nonomuraea rubra]|uniref:Uncharacterized protein n=1 Tax=Nonomuraea rubra TaxID=46180 RepID=A0A7X0P302_9ACTN|nr:hypothetical protein [Nonomuraea rubra]MBB6554106.1 hypothetical protein [Nonomuraea rubra]